MNSSKKHTDNGRPSFIQMIQSGVQWILIMLIRFYQLAISPWLGSNCRHTPTCSNYMMQAIEEWGALRGVWLGLKRLGKCHPFGTSGHDPVPKRNSNSENKPI